eukprot:4946652-Pyramimonas_sp.AAC.1
MAAWNRAGLNARPTAMGSAPWACASWARGGGLTRSTSCAAARSSAAVGSRARRCGQTVASPKWWTKSARQPKRKWSPQQASCAG